MKRRRKRAHTLKATPLAAGAPQIEQAVLQSPGNLTTGSPELEAATVKQNRFRTEQTRALKAVTALYGRVPSRDEVPFKEVEKKVNKWCAEHRLKPVERTSLRRALGWYSKYK
jgi:hypothetical protein